MSDVEEEEEEEMMLGGGGGSAAADGRLWCCAVLCSARVPEGQRRRAPEFSAAPYLRRLAYAAALSAVVPVWRLPSPPWSVDWP
ncbi:hypothetical protein CEP53_015355, partial [Fusarium sp. AF-6]